MPTSAAQAGTMSDMKASDSANASAPTIGAAHTWLTRTNSMIAWAYCSIVCEKSQLPSMQRYTSNRRLATMALCCAPRGAVIASRPCDAQGRRPPYLCSEPVR